LIASWQIALPLAAATALVPACGHAELGGTLSGVQSDGARMGARTASVAMSGYSRHDITRANGGMVREFTNAKGQVFAITWSGPGKPDLRSLLGRYFATYQAASSAAIGRTMHSLRRPPQVSQPDLQIQTGGHMGWFHGVAFIPSLAPAGYATSNLAVEP
jgi:hypothetical protein